MVIDYEVDGSGHLISGVVARHSTKKYDVYQLSVLSVSGVFKYTGVSTFPNI